MKLLTANRYYALNDRTINVLSQGEVDMSATTAEFGAAPASNTASDADVVDLVGSETEVDIFVADKHKTRAGGVFFKYLNLTLFNLENMDYLKLLVDTTISVTVCI